VVGLTRTHEDPDAAGTDRSLCSGSACPLGFDHANSAGDTGESHQTEGNNMRKTLLAILAATVMGFSTTSCSAGPHQLRRTVDDWDHKMYVNSPWVDGILWFIPVIPIAMFIGWAGDFLIVDAYSFWLHDAWDGKGTGFKHLDVAATDGTMSSLMIDGASFLQVNK